MKNVADVDAMGAMRNLTVTVRYHRLLEWKARSVFGLWLVRVGLRLTGMNVVVVMEDEDSAQQTNIPNGVEIPADLC